MIVFVDSRPENWELGPPPKGLRCRLGMATLAGGCDGLIMQRRTGAYGVWDSALLMHAWGLLWMRLRQIVLPAWWAGARS